MANVPMLAGLLQTMVTEWFAYCAILGLCNIQTGLVSMILTVKERIEMKELQQNVSKTKQTDVKGWSKKQPKSQIDRWGNRTSETSCVCQLIDRSRWRCDEWGQENAGKIQQNIDWGEEHVDEN